MSEPEIQFPHYNPPDPRKGHVFADRSQSNFLFKAIKHMSQRMAHRMPRRKGLTTKDTIRIRRKKPRFY